MYIAKWFIGTKKQTKVISGCIGTSKQCEESCLWSKTSIAEVPVLHSGCSVLLQTDSLVLAVMYLLLLLSTLAGCFQHSGCSGCK